MCYKNGNRLQIVVKKPTKKHHPAEKKYSEFMSNEQYIRIEEEKSIWTDLNVIFNHLINTLIHINIPNVYIQFHLWTFFVLSA